MNAIVTGVYDVNESRGIDGDSGYVLKFSVPTTAAPDFPYELIGRTEFDDVVV